MKLHRIVLVLTALVVTAAAYAASWRINPSPYAKAQFASVKEAMDDINVRAGDTLMLDPGYHGTISVTRENMTIIGPGFFLDQNKGWSESQAAICETANIEDGCKITGVVVNGSINLKEGSKAERCKANRINTNSRNATIEQNYCNGILLNFVGVCRNNILFGGGISCNYSDGAPGSVIENNTIVANTASALIKGIKNSTIRNNVIVSTATGFDGGTMKPSCANVLEFNTNNNNSINNNVLSIPADYADPHYKNNYFVGATVEGTFVNDGSDDGRYMLAPNSPAKGAASHGGDCGAFGGAQSYVLSGIPRFLPHITDVMVPAKPTDGKIVVKLKIANQDE